MRAAFPDHFSSVADAYRAFRPTYPDELFAFLAGCAPDRGLAWDCAAGSGQATAGLRPHFARVVATDASPSQLRNLMLPGIDRVACTAEAVALAGACADVIVVAQALHWMRIEELWTEVRRVARPGAVFAAWTYSLPDISAQVDPLLRRYHDQTLGNYWPHERRFVDDLYATLPLPFEAVAAPPFVMRQAMSLEHFIGYLGTWSARRRHLAATGIDPLLEFAAQLTEAWGRAGERELVWPVGLRVGRVA